MYLCKETSSLLHEQASFLTGPNASFRIHYWGVVPKLMENPVHKHSFFEICYVLDGYGTYMDDGIDYPLEPGVHFSSKPGITHQIRTEDGLFLLYVAFELDENKSQPSAVEQFRKLAQSENIWVDNGDNTPTALLWKSLLIQEQDSGNLPISAVVSVAYALIHSFLTLFGINERIIASARNSSNQIVNQAKHFIKDNLNQSLSLSYVARFLNVSERHLSRLFSEGIREGFNRYQQGERIHKATELLLNSNHSIKEIAELTGFTSVHYFTRLFMKEKGLPPAKFRKKNKV